MQRLVRAEMLVLAPTRIAPKVRGPIAPQEDPRCDTNAQWIPCPQQQEVAGGKQMFDQQSDPVRAVGRHEVLLGENVLQLGIVIVGEGLVAGLFDDHPFLARLADRIPARLAAELMIDRIFIRLQIDQVADRQLRLEAQARHVLRQELAIREFEMQAAELPEGEMLEGFHRRTLRDPGLEAIPMKSVVQPMKGEPRILMPSLRTVSPAKYPTTSLPSRNAAMTGVAWCDSAMKRIQAGVWKISASGNVARIFPQSSRVPSKG